MSRMPVKDIGTAALFALTKIRKQVIRKRYFIPKANPFLR